MSQRLVVENAVVATVDTLDWRGGAGTEHASGHVVVADGVITAVGAGPPPAPANGPVDRIDGHGALLERVPNPSDDVIREELSGNLCRCTGYAKIFDAVRLAARA